MGIQENVFSYRCAEKDNKIRENNVMRGQRTHACYACLILSVGGPLVLQCLLRDEWRPPVLLLIISLSRVLFLSKECLECL